MESNSSCHVSAQQSRREGSDALILSLTGALKTYEALKYIMKCVRILRDIQLSINI